MSESPIVDVDLSPSPGEGEKGEGSDGMKSPSCSDETAESGGVASPVGATPPQILHALGTLQQKLDEKEKALSTKNVEMNALTEINAVLQKELIKARSSTSGEITVLKKEFSKRIAEYESKLKDMRKEVAISRKKQTSGQEMGDLLRQKDEKIAKVMAEGETLSKKQMTLEGTIRRLRDERKELDASIAILKANEEKQKSKLEMFKEKVKSMDQKEKANAESLKIARVELESVRKQLGERSRELDVLQTAVSEKQELLDVAQSKLRSETDSQPAVIQAEKDRLQREHRMAIHELKKSMEIERRSFRSREKTLSDRILELEDSVASGSRDFEDVEESYRREITELRGKCALMEREIDALKAHSAESVGPVLRQLSALREESARNLEEAEAEKEGLLLKVSSLQLEVESISHDLEEKVRAATSIQASLETARLLNSQLTQEEANLRLSLSMSRTQQIQSESECSNLRSLLSNALSQRVSLEEEWNVERSRLKSLEEISSSLKAELEEKEREISELRSEVVNLKQIGEEQPPARSSPLRPSHDSGELPLPSIGEVERLKDLLHQKEETLSVLRVRVDSELSKMDGIVENLVQTQDEKKRLESEVARIPVLERELLDISGKCRIALEMTGEREERIEELTQDLLDVKEMYRDHLNQLCGEVERLKSENGR